MRLLSSALPPGLSKSPDDHNAYRTLDVSQSSGKFHGTFIKSSSYVDDFGNSFGNFEKFVRDLDSDWRAEERTELFWYYVASKKSGKATGFESAGTEGAASTLRCSRRGGATALQWSLTGRCRSDLDGKA